MAEAPFSVVVLWIGAVVVVAFAGAWLGTAQTPESRKGDAFAAGVIGASFGVALPFQIGWGWLQVPLLGLMGVLVGLAVIDIRTLRLPSRILVPGAVGVMVTSVTIVGMEGDWARLGEASLGAIGYFAVMFLLYRLSRDALGFGDVRLALLLGWSTGLFGWTTTVTAVVLASVIGAVVAGVALLGGATRKSLIPYGPPMMLGALIALLVA